MKEMGDISAMNLRGILSAAYQAKDLAKSCLRNCQRFQSSLSRSAVGWSQKWRELSVATTDEGDRRKAAIPHA
ncbi:MAG TPA: hypothetical protein VK192_01190, partial [Sphingomicrobium sp.]|nr:hypothetical protein [Sphingomicrobium sp.]